MCFLVELFFLIELFFLMDFLHEATLRIIHPFIQIVRILAPLIYYNPNASEFKDLILYAKKWINGIGSLFWYAFQTSAYTYEFCISSVTIPNLDNDQAKEN